MNKPLLPKHIAHYRKEKSDNPEQFQENWGELEEEIDRLVYALYGLNEEEIAIVEESV